MRAKTAWEASKASPDAITRALADQQEQENEKLRDQLEELRKKSADWGQPPAEPAPRPWERLQPPGARSRARLG